MIRLLLAQLFRSWRMTGIVIGLMLLLGCGLLEPQVKYTLLSSAEDIPPPVRRTILLTSASTLDREFVELGIIEVRGRADPRYLLQKMLEKAREVGADAVYKIEGVGDLAPQKSLVELPKKEDEETEPQRAEIPQIDLEQGISFFPRLITGIAVRYK